MVRLRASSQRCSSARLSDCAGSGASAGSVLSRHPSSSNATCRLSATPSRKRSNASESRPFKRSTAAPGSTGNPVRAQNASRTCSPLRGRQEEGLEATEVLRAVDGEVAGLDLVAHLEKQRALPAPTVGHAVAASRRAVFAVDPQRRQGRRSALALLVDELHPAQKRRGELAQPGVPLGRLLEAGPAVAPRPVRQIGLVLVQLRRRYGRQQSGPQLVVADVGIEQHGAEPAVALNDPVDGVAWRCALSMSSRRSSTRFRLRSRSLPYMSTAWSSVSRHAWCRKHTSAR